METVTADASFGTGLVFNYKVVLANTTQVACAQVKLALEVQNKDQQQPSQAHNFSLALTAILTAHLLPLPRKER